LNQSKASWSADEALASILQIHQLIYRLYMKKNIYIFPEKAKPAAGKAPTQRSINVDVKALTPERKAALRERFEKLQAAHNSPYSKQRNEIIARLEEHKEKQKSALQSATTKIPKAIPATKISPAQPQILVIVTFDLREAHSGLYKIINSSLRSRGVKRSIMKNDGGTHDLPSNIFCVKFKPGEHESVAAACSHVSTEIEAVFKQLRVKGKYFVSAASGWAWRMGGV
jgi:hypothetical protein